MVRCSTCNKLLLFANSRYKALDRIYCTECINNLFDDFTSRDHIIFYFIISSPYLMQENCADLVNDIAFNLHHFDESLPLNENNAYKLLEFYYKLKYKNNTGKSPSDLLYKETLDTCVGHNTPARRSSGRNFFDELLRIKYRLACNKVILDNQTLFEYIKCSYKYDIKINNILNTPNIIGIIDNEHKVKDIVNKFILSLDSEYVRQIRSFANFIETGNDTMKISEPQEEFVRLNYTIYSSSKITKTELPIAFFGKFYENINSLDILFKNKNLNIYINDLVILLGKVIDENDQNEEDKFVDKITSDLKNALAENFNEYNIVKFFVQMNKVDVKLIKSIFGKINIGNNVSTEQIETVIKNVRANILEHELTNENSLKFSDIKQKLSSVSNFENLDGREFEIFLEDYFKKTGFEVKKTPLTGDQGADLLIRKNDLTTVVQVKKYSTKVSNSAIQEVVAAKGFYKADKMLVITDNDFTNSAKELANRNNVELWNGDLLKEKLSELRNNLKSLQDVTVQQGKFKVNCPICNFEMMIDYEENMKQFSKNCPNCFVKITAKVT